MKLTMSGLFLSACMIRTTVGFLYKPLNVKAARLFSTGHQPSGGMNLTPEEERRVLQFKERQAALPRPTFAEEVKTLIDRSIGFGVLSTNSLQYPGFPTGSVVGFQTDQAGLPFFSFSTMSAHTNDLLKDGRASLTVMARNFQGAAEGRVVLIGKIKKVSDKEQREDLRARYLARHKDAYWIDFGDFTFFAMDSIEAIRFVGGFAMAGSILPGDYFRAQPDPLAAFAEPVMKHMNDDHAGSTAAMVAHYTGIPCASATIVGIDKLGLTTKAHLQLPGMGTGGYTKVRVPFPQEVTERKQLKEVLVEMTTVAERSTA